VSRPILLLDVMSTLVVDPFYEVMPSFFGMTLPELLRVKHPTAWVEFERGEMDGDTFLDRFFADGRDYDRDGFVEAVRGAYRYVDGIEPLLADLRAAGVPMHALSNYPRWFEWIEARLALSRYLDWSFVSCDTGVRKPDPEAYLGPVSRLGVAPERCLFVDDRESNCAAAREVGVPAVRFQSATQLREVLVAQGALRP
jgi:HAD superfamily hydrolase (TIGR01509 family)